MAVSTAVPQSARASQLGIKTTFKNLRPSGTDFLDKRIAVFGQVNETATVTEEKTTVTSSNEAAGLYGYGSPIHLAVRELLPDNGDGVGSIPVTCYPLLSTKGSGAAKNVTITTVGTSTENGSIKVVVNETDSTEITVASGDASAELIPKIISAVNAVLHMPVIASDGTTVVDLDAKWSGLSSNVITSTTVEVVGEVAGLSFTIADGTSGSGTPDLTNMVTALGNTWETFIVNCMNYDDTDVLDQFKTTGDGRWGATIRRPFVAIAGNTVADRATAVAISDARKTDRVNGLATLQGSKNLPFALAARAVARMAVVADTNPPKSYQRQPIESMTQGTDAEQWGPADREAALQAGTSTSKITNDVPYLLDMITFYHPDGESDPAWRYIVTHVKVWEVLYSTEQIFNGDDWAAAPLIPDEQATTNKEAKQPKMAKAAVASMIDALALSAILSDPDTAKATIKAEIDGSNPNRLNVSFTVQVSGNTNVKSVDLNFGFYFGGQ